MFGVGVASNYPTVSTTYGVDPHNSYYVLETNSDASGTKIVGTLEVTGTITGDKTIVAEGGFVAPQGAGGPTPTSTALYSSELNFYDVSGSVNTQAFKLEYDGTAGNGQLNIVSVPSNLGLHVEQGGGVIADGAMNVAGNLQIGDLASTTYWTQINGQSISFVENAATNPPTSIIKSDGAGSGTLDIITGPGSTPPSVGLHVNLTNGQVTADNGIGVVGGTLDMGNHTINLGGVSGNNGQVYYDAGNSNTVIADTAKIVNTTVGNTKTTTLDASGFTVNGGPINANGGLALPASGQIQFGPSSAPNYLSAILGSPGLDAVFTNSFQIFSAAALSVPVGTFGPGGLSVGNGTSPTRGNLSCGNMDCTGAPGNYNLDWSVQNPNSTPLSAQMRFNAFGLQFHLGKTATSDTTVTFIQPYPTGTYPIVLCTSANYDGGPVNQFSMATTVTNTSFVAHSTQTNQTGGNCAAYFLAIGPDPNA